VIDPRGSDLLLMLQHGRSLVPMYGWSRSRESVDFEPNPAVAEHRESHWGRSIVLEGPMKPHKSDTCVMRDGGLLRQIVG
jgi:hypothetical protein